MQRVLRGVGPLPGTSRPVITLKAAPSSAATDAPDTVVCTGLLVTAFRSMFEVVMWMSHRSTDREQAHDDRKCHDHSGRDVTSRLPCLHCQPPHPVSLAIGRVER